MSKKTGFKNCPSVTTIALGMDIEWHSGEYRIVAIDDSGRGLGFRSETGGTQWLGEYDLPACVLDLDSVWVGRKYRSVNSEICYVETVSDAHIVLSVNTSSSGLRVAMRDHFLEAWKPLPLGPAETDLTSDLILNFLQGSMEIGQEVSVTRDGTEYSGPLKSIDPVSKIFRLRVAGNNEPFDWTDQGTKVYMPETTSTEAKPKTESPFGPIPSEPDKLPKTVTCCDCGRSEIPLEDSVLCGDKIYCPTCAPGDDEPKANTVGVAKAEESIAPPEPGSDFARTVATITAKSKEAWRPKPGEKVLHIPSGDKVDVLAVWGGVAWIPWADTAETIAIDDLRPIPTEPPVKVGDYVAVINYNCDEYVGKVILVNDDLRYFMLCHAGPKFYWDAVTITRLVPDTLYAKMKKRLEEKLKEASRVEAWKTWDYMMQLRRALEAYAKEAR